MARKRDPEKKEKRESGLPGGGAGRRDEVGGSGVYPMSGPLPKGEAPIIPEPAWGQGERGSAGYEESGSSELWYAQSNPEQCRDVMSKDPICCVRSDTVEAAARIMRDRDIGPLPIVEDLQNKTLIGMVTDRDLVIRVIAEGRDPRTTKLDDVMTRDLTTCSPDDDLRKCLDAMEAHQVRRMPVVDNTGRVVGIISQADIAIRMRMPKQTAEVVEELSKPKVTGGTGR